MSSERISLHAVAERIGVPEVAGLDSGLLPPFVFSAMIGLTDGDMKAFHPPYEGLQADLFGRNEYSTGRVATAVLRAAIEDGPKEGIFYNFQSYLASMYLQPDGLPKSSTPSSVRIQPEVLVVDDELLALRRPPSIVIEYGGCLNSRNYLADQNAFTERGVQPFIYAPLTRTHFTNAVLLGTYDARDGQGTARAMLQKRLYLGREDGAAAGSDHFLQANREQGVPTDVADIIICTDTQHVTDVDMQRAMSNAYPLLREGGSMVVRASTQPEEGVAGPDEVAAWAYGAGFNRSKTLLRKVEGVNMRAAMLGRSAVYTMVTQVFAK